MVDQVDVVVVGSGMGAAAVYRSLHGRGLRIAVLEAGPAVAAGDTHLRNLLPPGEGSWRALVAAMLVPPVRLAADSLPNVPPPVATDGVCAGQQADEALPGLGNCRGIGGNALVWSGVVLPPALDIGITPDEFAQAASWLGAETVSGSPRQEWLQEAHGLVPVPLAWSAAHGWHGPRQLAGEGYAPLPSRAVRRIVHKGGRATGVELADRTLLMAGHVVVCAGVVGTVGLLWASALEPDLPGLGRGIAHHPLAVAQVAIPAAEWARIAQLPHLTLPAAVREFPAAGGGHTLIVAETPWKRYDRVDARATLSIYAYVTLDPDPDRRLSFASGQLGPDGMPLPCFVVPRSDAERHCEERALREVKAWAARLGPMLPSGRARVLPRGADQHLCAGARIGGADDPLAVADPSGRLRCLENVWIAGAAALPAPVSTHPTQTIVALAARTGRAISASFD